MTQQQIIIATILWFISISITYSHSGFNNIKNCYKMWFTREYWTNYNKVENVNMG